MPAGQVGQPGSDSVVQTPLQTSRLLTVAGRFHPPGFIAAVEPLGQGNVNDTHLVSLRGDEGERRFVLQRLNTAVFREPQRVMGNLITITAHMDRRLQHQGPAAAAGRWELPRPIPPRASDQPWLELDGEVWRALSFIEETVGLEAVTHPDQARELGRGLGIFHDLLHDLPAADLADTLEGFHVTPRYLAEHREVLQRVGAVADPDGRLASALAFVQAREDQVDLLEAAARRGELSPRPIHGDPKIGNVLFDATTGRAVALIDLDTVKPGLLHYDIGDALRSGCNPLGEEATDPAQVRFDLDLAAALLQGYLGAAGASLTAADRHWIPTAARLISFELGLRFLTDHLAGDVYFRTSHRGHNLQRALVQFQLCASIEEQLPALTALVQKLS